MSRVSIAYAAHDPAERLDQFVFAESWIKHACEAASVARANQMRVAVRGGGYNWVGFSLRDDSLLIDLGRLKKVSIDREARRAIVQPATTGRELNRMLNAQGL